MSSMVVGGVFELGGICISLSSSAKPHRYSSDRWCLSSIGRSGKRMGHLSKSYPHYPLQIISPDRPPFAHETRNGGIDASDGLIRWLLIFSVSNWNLPSFFTWMQRSKILLCTVFLEATSLSIVFAIFLILYPNSHSLRSCLTSSLDHLSPL